MLCTCTQVRKHQPVICKSLSRAAVNLKVLVFFAAWGFFWFVLTAGKNVAKYLGFFFQYSGGNDIYDFADLVIDAMSMTGKKWTFTSEKMSQLILDLAKVWKIMALRELHPTQ